MRGSKAANQAQKTRQVNQKDGGFPRLARLGAHLPHLARWGANLVASHGGGANLNLVASRTRTVRAHRTRRVGHEVADDEEVGGGDAEA